MWSEIRQKFPHHSPLQRTVPGHNNLWGCSKDALRNWAVNWACVETGWLRDTLPCTCSPSFLAVHSFYPSPLLSWDCTAQLTVSIYTLASYLFILYGTQAKTGPLGTVQHFVWINSQFCSLVRNKDVSELHLR